ncbi:hypothetical protein JYB88_14460 [Shewanella cyperi]|uniref:Membrane bound FAD containing D-sorbitol dehydrogenase n=1 Tax=Shewanella cyperi TaxID=2814292 RepID=A0A974XJ89_9GAMM|nr:sugar dehydrogenase complex small subunit [Shewanella cyperi]QSX29395.1 hypothetical protein JYB88_14460 [Shewanella cyperi]
MHTTFSAEPGFQQFISLSVLLTGFNRFELLGTGQADNYFQLVQQQCPDKLETLLALFSRAPAEPQPLNAFIEVQIMQSSELGPLARSLIKLWYLGQWDSIKGDDSFIPSPQAYQEGLVWQAIHAHPQGAKQQGFGAWAEPPATELSQPDLSQEVAP